MTNRLIFLITAVVIALTGCTADTSSFSGTGTIITDDPASSDSSLSAEDTDADPPENNDPDNRIDLVSEESRIWFDEDGNIRYFQDLDEISLDERRAIVIPDDIFEVATTEELFYLTFEWAYKITDPYFYDFASYYINYIYSWFNGLHELLTRPDLGEFLISEYRKMEYISADKALTEDERRMRHMMALTEILLALDSTYDDLNDSQRLEIVSEIFYKSRSRDSISEYSRFFYFLQEKDICPYTDRVESGPDFYNRNWYWNTFISDNCSADIAKMLERRFW